VRGRALAGATGALLIASLGCHSSRGAQTGTSTTVRRQSVAIDLTVDYDGNATLHASSIGIPYTIDPGALSFSARRLGEPGGTQHPLDVTIGAVQLAQHGRLEEFVMPITFGRSPADGGLWNAEPHAAKQFATPSDGLSLPLGDWSRPTDRWHIVVWWPSQNDVDRLSKVRDGYFGHNVYAYGGLALKCGPNVAAFDASAPLRVVAIEREQNRVAMLWPGTRSGNDLAPRFVAIEPLRFVFSTPPAGHQLSFGSNIEGKDCPAVELADWQIDSTFSLKPPPASLDLRRKLQALHAGLTRDEVAWLLGYPTDFASRDKILHERTWFYDVGPRFSTTVVFRGDRIASFKAPDIGTVGL
jgi:hypothetical protein